MKIKNICESSEFKFLDTQLFSNAVPAGLPCPAKDYCERKLDLNELCIQHPAATFFVRAQDESMIEAGGINGSAYKYYRSYE